MSPDHSKTAAKSKVRQRQRSKSPAPDSPASSTKSEGVKVSPKSGPAFPGYNSFHPVLRIYSNAPVASASTSTASATGSTFDDQHSQNGTSPQHRGSPKLKKQSTLDSRPRKSSTESLRRHIATQTQHSPTTSEGSRTTARSSSSPRMFTRSSSSSSSSSLSSLAGTDPPKYIQGLGLNVKAAVPLPPAVANDVAFPSMEKTSSIPTDLSPAHSTESLKSCFKEAPRGANGNGHSAESNLATAESPTTRKRRSVSFAVEDPVVHRLRSASSPHPQSSDSNTSLGDYITSVNERDRQEEQDLVPFPSFDRPAPRPRRLSGIFPERFIGMDMAGSLYTYIRSNTLSTFSSHTSWSSSSEDWEGDSNDERQGHRHVGLIRMLVETTLGLSLAIGWLAIARVFGATAAPRRPPPRIHDELNNDDGDTTRTRLEP